MMCIDKASFTADPVIKEPLLERALFLTSSGHCTDSEGEVMIPLILALLEEHDNAEQVKACLKNCGDDVFVVDTFTKAIALLKTQKIDLIISDVHLENGGNVFDFLKWMKKNLATSATPFVMFSSHPTVAAKYLEDGIRISARMLGAAKYITMETFDSDEFRKQIDSLLPVGEQAMEPSTKGKQ
jgi:CheY-like chemotaxis protein